MDHMITDYQLFVSLLSDNLYRNSTQDYWHIEFPCKISDKSVLSVKTKAFLKIICKLKYIPTIS